MNSVAGETPKQLVGNGLGNKRFGFDEGAHRNPVEAGSEHAFRTRRWEPWPAPPRSESPRRSFIVAADRFLASFPDPLEIPCVRTAFAYGVVDAITEAVRQDGVVHGSVAALFVGEREVLVSGDPVAHRRNRLEVARASKLLGAEAFGHLACELRDVTLLGRLDEDSLRAEPLQLGCSRSATFRIPLNPRHAPTLLR